MQKTVRPYTTLTPFEAGDACVWESYNGGDDSPYIAVQDTIGDDPIHATITPYWRPATDTDIKRYINNFPSGRWCGPAMTNFLYEINDTVEKRVSDTEMKLLRANIDQPSDPTVDESDWTVISGLGGGGGGGDTGNAYDQDSREFAFVDGLLQSHDSAPPGFIETTWASTINLNFTDPQQRDQFIIVTGDTILNFTGVSTGSEANLLLYNLSGTPWNITLAGDYISPAMPIVSAIADTQAVLLQMVGFGGGTAVIVTANQVGSGPYYSIFNNINIGGTITGNFLGNVVRPTAAATYTEVINTRRLLVQHFAGGTTVTLLAHDLRNDMDVEIYNESATETVTIIAGGADTLDGSNLIGPKSRAVFAPIPTTSIIAVIS